MITADFNKQHTLFVTFNDFPAIPESEPTKHMQARIRIKEAGYDFEPYGLTDIVSRSWQEDGKYIPNLTKKESIHCDPATLTGAALSLGRDDLAELIASAFTVYQQAQATYEQEIKLYRESAHSRRGRPPMIDGEKRDAFVGANVATDLKEWASSQPEGISALINRLLIEERKRRKETI